MHVHEIPQLIDKHCFLLQLHECPNRAIVALMKEAFRLLRPAGTIAIVDNSVREYPFHCLDFTMPQFKKISLQLF